MIEISNLEFATQATVKMFVCPRQIDDLFFYGRPRLCDYAADDLGLRKVPVLRGDHHFDDQ